MTQNMSQQLYNTKPVEYNDVQGLSSRTIFTFMTNLRIGYSEFPWDVDDWERNRALLICYPEWKPRLHEMIILSPQWKVLVENWGIIEDKYNKDYEKYGNKAYGEGECDTYIRSLLKSVQK